MNPNEISEFHGKNYTFLIFKAIEVGSAELVKILLDFGASADVEDYRGLKTFHVAAIDGKSEIADLLLAASTDADDFARTVCRAVASIHQALLSRDETRLFAALENWPRDPRGSKYLDWALWTTVLCATINCLKALLDKGANPNARFYESSVIDNIVGYYPERSGGYTMMHLEDFLKVQLLLDYGADLEGEKYTVKPELSSSGDECPIVSGLERGSSLSSGRNLNLRIIPNINPIQPQIRILSEASGLSTILPSPYTTQLNSIHSFGLDHV